MTNLVKTIIVTLIVLAILSVGIIIGFNLNSFIDTSSNINIEEVEQEEEFKQIGIQTLTSKEITDTQARDQLAQAIEVAEKYWTNEPTEENLEKMDKIFGMYGGAEANIWNDYCSKTYTLWQEMANPKENDTPMKTIMDSKKLLNNERGN